jgi:hypothetical protein
MTTTFATYIPPAPVPSPAPVVDLPSAQPQTELRTWRDTLRQIVPVWLRGKNLGGVLFAVGSIVDTMNDALVGSVKARFPGKYGTEPYGIIGRERRIRRGRTEPDATYQQRLVGWLDAHALRGGPIALLQQLWQHYAPNNFAIELVYANGRRFSLAVDGSITWDDVGDFHTAEWAHWTLYFHWPDPVHTDGVWDDAGTWDDGGVWDSDLTPQEVTDLRLIPREWNAAHCFGNVVLLNSSIELWDYPVGTWDDPGGVWLPDSAYAIQFSIE